MILGTGTDLVSIARIEQILARHADRFVNRVFTPEEQRLCALRKAVSAACWAKRFAAKEAVVKALGTGMRDGIWFTDVEILNDPLGRPVVTVTGEGARRLRELGSAHGVEKIRIHLSLADESGFALAYVLLEGH
ncbi:MAG: holo-ACP synthase [Magnetococcales bacterium]|nr:holo-ACP synthase [Magnetococcales bacterium]